MCPSLALHHSSCDPHKWLPARQLCPSVHATCGTCHATINLSNGYSLHCVACGLRLTALKEPVYSQREAEMAAGMGNYLLKTPGVAQTDVDMGDTNDVSVTT